MTLERDHAGAERLRTFAKERFGLWFEDAKLPHLAEVFCDRLEATRRTDVDAYFRLLDGRDDRAVNEARAIAERLTVNETYFFRYGEQCRAFAHHALQSRSRARSDERELRILSAGSASGEEAYTLAMLIRDYLPGFESWRITLVGIDINVAMLEKARRARYSAWSLRETSRSLRERYFRPNGSELELDPRVRAMVRFEERNVIEDDPVFWSHGAFDVVFCRNVMMYFSPEVMRAVVRRIARALAPGGFLFLGHAETLRAMSNDFHLRHTHDTFYYERRDEPVELLGSEIVRARDEEIASAMIELALDPADTSWVEAIRGASERIASLHVPAVQPASARPMRRAPDLASAFELLRSERFEEGLDQLHALPVEVRDDPDALLLRAVLLTNGGRTEEAATTARELLARDELHAGAHYVMAMCCEHAGRLDDALEHDRAAMYLDQEFAMPHLHFGLISKRRGDTVASRGSIERALVRLAREDASRVLLFGGGFSREALISICRAELRANGSTL